MGSAAHAQSTAIVLEEGTNAGDVVLDGDDNLVVDISRVTPEDAILHYDSDPALADSITNAGGNDKIWLRATETQTVQIVRPRTAGNQPNPVHTADGLATFNGGTVYEARGVGTVLTLQNKNSSGQDVSADLLTPIRIAGDGTVDITFSITSANQAGNEDQALYVEKNLDNDERTLNVILTDLIVSGGISDKAAIDVTNAKSLTLRGEKDTLYIRTGTSVGIEGGEADIYIDKDVVLQAFGSNSTHAMIRSSGKVVSRTRSFNAANGGVNQRAVGVELIGGQFYNLNAENNAGTDGYLAEVLATGSAVAMTSDDNYVENYGLLQSSYDAAISSYDGTAVTRNGIYKVTNGTKTFAGQIVGGMVGGQKVAYQDKGSAVDFLVNSGTIDGHIDFGFGDDMFLYTGATNGVTGTIDGGDNGYIDGYGKSFSATATHALDNNILGNGNIGFEMHGIEARGLGTTVTVTSPAGTPLSAGLMLIGDGTVINEASITASDFYGMYLRSIANVPSALRVVNKGDISTEDDGVFSEGGVASFHNEALISAIGSGSSGVEFSIIPTSQVPTLTFNNSGTIEATWVDGEIAAYFAIEDNSDAVALNFVNSGTIRSTGRASSYSVYGGTAVRIDDYSSNGARVRFVNSGTIQANGRGSSALDLGGIVDAANTSLIEANGIGSGAVGFGASADNATSTFLNSGTINANGGMWIEDFGRGRRVATAIYTYAAGEGSKSAVTNESTGVISATGAGSTAIHARGNSEDGVFTLVNRGRILGAADYTFNLGGSQGDIISGVTIDGNVLAGAIHTNSSIDIVRNESGGLIQGNVDLEAMNDEFYNYGRVEGDVRLGDGADKYIYAAGGELTGTAYGGVNGGSDSIRVDFSVAGTRKIDASKFLGFEFVAATDDLLHNESVSLHGAINSSGWNIRDIIVNIDQGDTLSSVGGANTYTLSGSAGQETVNNYGTIAGGLSLAGGDDTVTNTGSIGGPIFMDEGNDRVTNSGLINGNVEMGDDNDALTNNVGGTINGYVQLGNGDDVATNAGTIKDGIDAGNGNNIVTNSGTIKGDLILGDGNDIVTNSGTIDGNVDLGDGNDRYEALGGLVTANHTIDGGAGDNDIFIFRMNGNDGSIPGGFTNFESFGAYGPGTLTLALNENYNTIELLENANLTLQDGTGTVSLIKGDATSQVVKIEDADFNGSVDLGAGDDTLEILLSGALTGQLDGGLGTDTLKLNLTAASSINDLYNFEIVNVAGASPLTLTGKLGQGQQINFDAGDNTFIVDTGAIFEGTANGGAGNDTIQINTGATNSRTIVAGQIVNFENLDANGAGTLELNGEAYSFKTVDVEGNLSIGNGASLASEGGVVFSGNGNHRLTLNGTGNVTSAVTGGTGVDTLEFALAEGQTRNISTVGEVTAFERLAASGAGTLNIDQNTTYQQIFVEGGHINVAANKTLTATIGLYSNNDDSSLSIETGASIIGNIEFGDGNDVVTNAGTIGDLSLGLGDDFYFALAGSQADSIDGGVGGNDTFVFRLAGGEGVIPTDVTNFESFGAYGPGTLTVNLDANQDYTDLRLYDQANLVINGSNGSVSNVIGDDSAQIVTINGNLTGGVDLGGGNDTLNMSLGGILSGALKGGLGQDTMNLVLTAASTVNGMSGFEVINIDGEYSFTLAGDLAAGQEVNFLGEDDNELIIAAGVKFEGKVNGGAGSDLLRVQSGSADSRTVVASQIASFEQLISEGAGTLALTQGAYTFDSVEVNGGNFELGANTTLNSEGGVTFDGANNRFTLGSGAVVNGGVDGGAGQDTLALVQGAGTVRVLSALDQQGFETLETSGAGELRIDENATFTGGVFIDGGTTTITSAAALTADVQGGANSDTLAVLGTLDGNVDLAGGDDTLVVSGFGNITGSVTGGADGNDRLVFNTAGTYEVPTVVNAAGLASFDSFESFGVSGGVVALEGATDWTNVTVTGGRLIGLAGSTITSETAIEVAHGATFGSAGTVNGDINVAGTLSPGASPGTMTVNGDVNFLAGSNLLLELTPEVSDLLNISGKMTIANGAAVDITGVLEGTPGNTLDLVVAEGGIEGRFTTINKSSTVFGFVVQNGNRLQIQSEFLAEGDFPSNVQTAVDYSNQVLRAGYGIQAFTAALPVLVDAQGNINEAAFAQLTPEAYGSATQIGIENSLQVVDNARTLVATTPAKTGLYGFAQAMMTGAEIKGQPDTGASKARFEGEGYFGGVGYGFAEGTQVGAFIGKIDTDQSLDRLRTETTSNGFVAGVYADAKVSGIGIHGLFAYNGSEAETRRTIAAAPSSAQAKYDVKSWVADLSVDYAFEADGWSVGPKVGVTYVNTKRDGVVEEGAGDFGLTVESGSKDSVFADASVAVSRTFAVEGMGVTPFAEVGVRQMLNDGDVLVTGGFTGADATMVVNGVERDKTVGRFSVGFGLDVTKDVRFHAGYTGEFADTKRDAFRAGAVIRF